MILRMVAEISGGASVTTIFVTVKELPQMNITKTMVIIPRVVLFISWCCCNV